MTTLHLDDSDFLENPSARVPVCLCLDTSLSMKGDPIDELNEGVRLFFDAIKADEVARFAAETCVVTFGSTPTVMVDFASVEQQEPPHLAAAGSTSMGAAVGTALDLLESRKKAYSSAGIDYYQPWLVLMTDGAPTDSYAAAAARTAALVRGRKLTVFPIGVGASANLTVLEEFSPGRTPLRLRGLAFSQFFEWLSKSVARVSLSVPGELVPLDKEGLQGWATL